MASTLLVPVKAQRACVHCRYRKQHCDKALPRCGRCASKDLSCDYHPSITSDTSFGAVATGVRVRTNLIVERHKSCHCDLTQTGSSLILREWQQLGLNDGEGAGLGLTPLVTCILEEAGYTAAAPSAFLAQIHPWFPILRKQRFLEKIKCFFDSGIRTLHSSAIALLILCTHLLSATPCGHLEHPFPPRLYATLKRVFFELQVSLVDPPVELLQAGLFITLFESAHGMHRAAYLTLSSCATLARMNHVNCVARLEVDVSTSDEIDVACWAMLVLDRVVWITEPNSGFPLLFSRRNDTTEIIRHLEQQDRNKVGDEAVLSKFYTLALVSASLGDKMDTEVYEELAQSENVQQTTAKHYLSLLETMLRLSQSSSALYLCDATALTVSAFSILQARRRAVALGVTACTDTDYQSPHSFITISRNMVQATMAMATGPGTHYLSAIGLIATLRAAMPLGSCVQEVIEADHKQDIGNVVDLVRQRWLIANGFSVP